MNLNFKLLNFVKELPEQWQATKKLALTVKQQVAPLQAAEVSGIRKKIATFESHVSYYREVFKRYDVSTICNVLASNLHFMSSIVIFIFFVVVL